MPTAMPDLGNGPIAISLVGDQSVALANLDGQPVELTLAHVKHVLQDYPTATFVADNAVKLHHAIASAFARDRAGLRLLWDLSASGRLIDLPLLHQRVRVAVEGVHPKPRTPDELLQLSQKLPPRNNCVVDPAISPHILHDLLSLHHRLVEITGNDTEGGNVDTALSHAPFGTALDVQGTIALRAIKDRGIQLDEDQIPRLRAAAESAFAKASREIRTHGQPKAGFMWCADEKTKVLLDEGRPTIRELELRRYLKNLAAKSADFSLTRRLPPLGDDGQISVEVAHWRHWSHPAIIAWFDLNAAAAVLRTFDASTTVKLNFEVIPQILPEVLNFSEFRRFGSKPFRARADHKFAVVTLDGLSMRCFAHVLDWYFPSGAYPGNMYRIGKDPIEETAASLWVADRGAPDDCDRSGFAQLMPRERLKWIMITGVLYRSVARGYSNQEVRWALKTEMPSETFVEREIEKLQRNVRDERHEFAYILDNDHILRLLAERTGRSTIDLTRKYWVNELPGAEARAAQNDAIRSGHFEQLLSWPRSEIGRMSTPALPTQVPAAECRELEDEIRISILYRLVRAGWCPVGFAGDDFVIEVPTDQATPEVLQQIEQACRQGVRAITDDSMFDCFSCQLADRW